MSTLSPDILGVVIGFVNSVGGVRTLELSRVSTAWMQAVAQQDWWWNGPDTLLLDLLDPMQCELAAARMALDGAEEDTKLCILKYHHDGMLRIATSYERKKLGESRPKPTVPVERLLLADPRIVFDEAANEVLGSLSSFVGGSLAQLMFADLITPTPSTLSNINHFFPQCISVAFWIGAYYCSPSMQETYGQGPFRCCPNVKHISAHVDTTWHRDYRQDDVFRYFPNVEVVQLGMVPNVVGTVKKLPKTVRRLHTHSMKETATKRCKSFSLASKVMEQLPQLDHWTATLESVVKTPFASLSRQTITVVQAGAVVQDLMSSWREEFPDFTSSAAEDCFAGFTYTS